MTDKILQFTDDVSAMNETAEEVLQIVERTKHKNPALGAILSSISLLLKSQAVLADIMLEVLRSLNRTL